MRSRAGRLVVAALVVLVAAACDFNEEPRDDGEEESPTPTPTPPSFAELSAIFSTRCALSGCHAGDSPPEGLSLTSSNFYSQTINVAAFQTFGGGSLDRVEPGDPSASYLFRKVTAAPGISGTSMPPGGPLPALEIATLENWIVGLAVSPTPTPSPTPIGPVTWSSVSPIFVARCATSSCHTTEGPPETLTLTEAEGYAQTVNVVSMQATTDGLYLDRVEPGLPMSSYLYLKLIADPLMSGSQMPLGASPLSQAHRDTVRDWIEAGAPP